MMLDQQYTTPTIKRQLYIIPKFHWIALGSKVQKKEILGNISDWFIP